MSEIKILFALHNEYIRKKWKKTEKWDDSIYLHPIITVSDAYGTSSASKINCICILKLFKNIM